MAKKLLKNGNWTICPANDGSELNLLRRNFDVRIRITFLKKNRERSKFKEAKIWK